jgi:hypothetical protein
MNGASYFKPAQTGAIATPHQIPFELHRPPPIQLPSHIIRKSTLPKPPIDIENSQIQQPQPQPQPQQQQITTQQQQYESQTQPNNLERAVNVIWSLARNPLFPKQVTELAEPVVEQLTHAADTLFTGASPTSLQMDVQPLENHLLATGTTSDSEID